MQRSAVEYYLSLFKELSSSASDKLKELITLYNIDQIKAPTDEDMANEESIGQIEPKVSLPKNQINHYSYNFCGRAF